MVWSWQSDAFGATAANEDPDGDGVNQVVDLRFPGQYYDSETGLHYNYRRYYNPSTGRYITSDPIGVLGQLHVARVSTSRVSGDEVTYINNSLLFGVGSLPASDVESMLNDTAVEHLFSVPNLNLYSYVGGNPISRIDPTGEWWQVIPPVVGTCFALYCTNRATSTCKSKYPNYQDPIHTDKSEYWSCVSSQVKACAALGGLISDPIGSAASTAGGAAGKSCDDCQ